MDCQLSNQLFALLLVNILPHSEFGLFFQHFLLNISKISTSQVCACIYLEASGNTNKSKSKDMYAG